MLYNVKLLLISTAILAIMGNLGIKNSELRAPTVFIHYFGLLLMCVHSFIFLSWKITLLILIVDVLTSFLSFIVFSKRN